MRKVLLAIFLIATSILYAQTTAKGGEDFTLGADISWYSEMADKGYVFKYGAKNLSCPELIARYGMTAARFRVWVNPKDGYCGKDDVVKKALAAKNAGLDVLIDFHFSDSWADPAHQEVPALWKDGATYSSVRTKLGEHVEDVLSALVNEGVVPRWVQIGNETNDGFLWDFGKASTNPRQYAGFVNAGYNSVKKICPDTKVIVHVSNGYDQALFDWNLGELKRYSAQYDIIGMSLYPGNDENADEMIDKTMKNVRHLKSQFNKPCMIVETGLPVSSNASVNSKNKQLMASIIEKAQNATDGACLGVLYWEPECPQGWGNYGLGAATLSTGAIRFTPVMEAFKEAGEALGIGSPVSKKECDAVYSVDGVRLSKPQKGINIIGGKKVLVKE